ncbi:hypothetical protein DERP_010162 [Dermatophagoides pteronyssinus]|uniref:Uncharacterized protein n=1 Tax=Dermatophagoides pteronyssinus TaxID=6956 RepID=A0ABQ8J6U2_DERPT|nr:hypothetical protein DERP_010162 [Dermatophagoides pteronyssinus]
MDGWMINLQSEFDVSGHNVIPSQSAGQFRVTMKESIIIIIFRSDEYHYYAQGKTMKRLRFANNE